MHILIGLVAAIGGLVWWWMRSNPHQTIDIASDVATTVRNAPRKLAFRKQANAHPVEGIDDERIAICAIAQSFIELDDLPTAEKRDALGELLRTELVCTRDDAHEMQVLGRWLMTECHGPQEAIPRLGKRLKKIDRGDAWDDLQNVLGPLSGDALSSKQISAAEDLKLIFRK
ncbi:MAG: hypothetical protein AAGL23_02640 [Pseudomonadota bacterium]